MLAVRLATAVATGELRRPPLTVATAILMPPVAAVLGGTQGTVELAGLDTVSQGTVELAGLAEAAVMTGGHDLRLTEAELEFLVKGPTVLVEHLGTTEEQPPVGQAQGVPV